MVAHSDEVGHLFRLKSAGVASSVGGADLSIGVIGRSSHHVLPSLLFSEGFAPELDPMGVVDDAIEDGVGQGRIADQIMPSIDRDLAGDQRGTSAVPFLGDLQEVAALFRTERFQPPIVQDQQLHSAECPHKPGVTTIAMCQRQIGEQPGDTLVEYRVIVAACLMSKRAGEPRFPNSGRGLR
jgi:hypothetical protein